MAGDRQLVEEQIVEQRQRRQTGRHVELVQVVFPPVRHAGNQREHGNRAEQQHERQDHEEGRRLQQRFLIVRLRAGFQTTSNLGSVRATAHQRRPRKSGRHARHVSCDRQPDGRSGKHLGATFREPCSIASGPFVSQIVASRPRRVDGGSPLRGGPHYSQVGQFGRTAPSVRVCSTCTYNILVFARRVGRKLQTSHTATIAHRQGLKPSARAKRKNLRQNANQQQAECCCANGRARPSRLGLIAHEPSTVRRAWPQRGFCSSFRIPYSLFSSSSAASRPLREISCRPRTARSRGVRRCS